MKLIAGLGNPGAEYAGTRHNVGFEVIDALAVRLGLAGPKEFGRVARTRFEGLALEGIAEAAGGEKVLLLEPMTYMNDSGRSVQAALAFYKMAATDVLVVSDDVALPCGRIRLRADGSSGGHNGLADIERALGTDRYSRLRIGIDPPPSVMAQRDYVLGRFSAPQRPLVDQAIGWATDAALIWMQRGIAAAMNQFNGAGNAGEAGGKN